MPKRAVIKFFIDQNVPDSVGVALRNRGHHVTLLREVIPTASPDPLVASTALLNRAVLVSFDRDFDQKRAESQIGHRHNKLSRIILKCREPEAAPRVGIAMSLIEAEWRLMRSKAGTQKRMMIEILGLGIKTVR
jgi:predicted nuclease of predicted toxin-antitoxin system